MKQTRHTIILLLIIISPCICTNVQAQTSVDTLKIFYNIDKVDIDSAQAQLIARFIKKHKDERTTYEIFGYADYLSNRRHNLMLSEERADIMKHLLYGYHIPEDKITTCHGMGQQPPLLGKNNRQGVAANRRVDIIAHTTKKEPIIIPESNPAALTEPAPKPVPPVEEEIKPDSTTPISSKQLGSTLAKLKPGETMVLKNLNFYAGTHHLMPPSLPVLDTLLKTMKQHPSLKIQLQGHVCCVHGPGDTYDYDSRDYYLSKNRAQYIYEYLSGNGIDPRRLSYVGFGHSKPLTQETTDDEKAQNRRVEVMIVK